MIKRSFTIKDISQITGITANRLRVWKKRYDILKPERIEGKTNLFNTETLRYMMKIAKMLEQGYRISDVLDMEEKDIDDKLHSWIQRNDPAYLQQLRDAILEDLLELKNQNLQLYYSKALERVGLKRTVKELLFPLLNTLGSLWEIGTIHSVHEHLFSHFVRQKLIVAIDQLEPDLTKPEIVLFLPDQELHEISLLFIQYQLLNGNKNPTYLGGSVPYPDLSDYLAYRDISIAVTYLSYFGDVEYHLDQFSQLVRNFSSVDFYFSVPDGYYKDFENLVHADLEGLNNLHIYKDRQDLVTTLLEAT